MHRKAASRTQLSVRVATAVVLFAQVECFGQSAMQNGVIALPGVTVYDLGEKCNWGIHK